MTFNLPDLARVSLDEIIFEGRNQAYGAFELRRAYDQHLKRAVVLTLALCLLLIGAPLAWRALEKDVVVVKPKQPDESEYVISDKMPPLEKLPVQEQRAVAQPKVNTTEFLTRRVVTDKSSEKTTDVIDQALLATANVGTTTITDGVDGYVAPPVPVTTDAGGTEAPIVSQTWEYVEQMPEFEGGLQALSRFLGKNLQYPALALRNQVEGKIFLKFVVNERGEVDNPTVLKGLGAGLDEEALRVVRLLHFRPGMQNGRPVKVYFSLPISFQIR